MELDTPGKHAYWLISMLVGVVTALLGWWYAIDTYGWFLGGGLGWFPAICLGFIAGFLWPIAAIALALLLFTHPEVIGVGKDAAEIAGVGMFGASAVILIALQLKKERRDTRYIRDAKASGRAADAARAAAKINQPHPSPSDSHDRLSPEMESRMRVMLEKLEHPPTENEGSDSEEAEGDIAGG